MAQFHYQALNAQRQFVVGELHAESVAQAVAQLEAEGLTVQSIGYAASETSSSPTTNAATGNAAGGSGGTRPSNAGGESPFRLSVEESALRSHMARVLERSRAMLPALHAFAA